MSDIIGPDLLSKRRPTTVLGTVTGRMPRPKDRWQQWRDLGQQDLAEHEKAHVWVERTDYCADPEHCTHHDMPVLHEERPGVACAVLHRDSQGRTIPCPGYPHPQRTAAHHDLPVLPQRQDSAWDTL